MSNVYPRLPLGFIALANRTISFSPVMLRCSSRATRSQMSANNSKSRRFPDCKWVASKVRDDARQDGREATNLPLHRSVAPIRPEAPAREVLLHQQQHLNAVDVLADRQTRPRFPSDKKRRTRRNRYRKASFTINVPRDIRRQIDVASLRARVLPQP